MNHNQTSVPSPALLTVQEACMQLRISRWMIYRLIQRNELTTFTIGTRRLIAQADLETYVQVRRQESA